MIFNCRNYFPYTIAYEAFIEEVEKVDKKISEEGTKKDPKEGISEEERKKDLNKRQLAQNRDERKGSPTLSMRRGTVSRTFTKSEASMRSPTPDQLIREAEQKYLAAISILSRDVNRHRSQLDAETALRFERTLAAIDRTITDTRRAVREHPGDPVAAQYMLTAYAKKVDVLREMIGY